MASREARAIVSNIENSSLDLLENEEAIQAIKENFYKEVAAQCVSSGLVDGEIISNKIISRAFHRLKSIPKGTSKASIAAKLKEWQLQDYKIGLVGDRECLIKTVNQSHLAIIPWDTSFEIIWKMHLATGHPKGSELMELLRKKFVVNKFVVKCINKVCTVCIERRKPNRKTALYCLDMTATPDNTFSHIMVYEDLQTNFLHLRPIGSEDKNLEISMELFKIFMDFGLPVSVQISDVSLAKVIDNVKRLLSPCRISISLVETNQTKIKRLSSLITEWITHNHCNNWGIGCHMLQGMLNNKRTHMKGKSPHIIVFKDHNMINEDSSEDEDLQKANINTLAGHGEATGHNISFGDPNYALEISLTLSKAFTEDEMSVIDPTTALQKENTEKSKVTISEEDLKSEKSFTEDNDNTSASPQPGPSHRSPVAFDSTPNIKSSQSPDNSTPEATSPNDNVPGNFISGDLPIKTTNMETDSIEDFLSDSLDESDLPDDLIDKNTCIVCDKSVSSDSGMCGKCNRYVHLECQMENLDGGARIKCKLCHKLDNLFSA